MEPRFGVDFSHVRIHTGSDSAQMNRDVGAQAFTHGSDIYYGAGSSATNLELTAHELTHVVQQTGGSPLQTKRSNDLSSVNKDLSLRRTCTACSTNKEEEKESDVDSSRGNSRSPQGRAEPAAAPPVIQQMQRAPDNHSIIHLQRQAASVLSSNPLQFITGGHQNRVQQSGIIVLQRDATGDPSSSALANANSNASQEEVEVHTEAPSRAEESESGGTTKSAHLQSESAAQGTSLQGEAAVQGVQLSQQSAVHGTDAGQEQAAPVQEPRDESLELPESDPGAQPTSVMVGGGSSGGGAPDSGGGSGDQPNALSPERQAAAIIADSAQSEQQVNAVAAAHRGQISARFGAVRTRVTGLLASSSAGIKTFLTARQAEVQATTASVLNAGQAMLAGAVRAAQGQIQQARTVLDGVAGSAMAALEGQVSQTAGRITGLVDGLPLPNLPGVSAIRAGARALAGRAASAVTATLGQVRGLVGAALQQGAGLLGSLLSSVSEAASSALNRIGSMIQAAVRSVFAGLGRIGAALLDGLRRALDGTVLAGLRRVESTLSNNLIITKRQAITALHANRDKHLQALRDGRGATDGSPNLAEEARQNNVAVVTTFRERATSLLGSIFDAIGAGASALSQHLGQLVSRVIAVVQAPLTQILTGLRQVGQAISGFVQSLLSDLAAGITSAIGFVRSLIQNPLDAVMNFATRAVSKAGQFFAGLPSRLIGGNLSLPGVTELIGDPQSSGPITKPRPPGTIVKPILTFLSLLFLIVGAIVLSVAPSLVAAVSAVLVFLGIIVAPELLLIIVGVVAVAALIAALVLLYLLYRLIEPGPKPPPPVITHKTDFSAPDGSPKNRDDVGVGEHVLFTGSAAGTWTASAGSPRRGTGSTFAWVAPERRRSVTIRLVVGRGTASAKLSVLEPNSIVAHKLSDQKPAPGKFGAGMFLDFEFHPLRVSFGNAATREVEGPASAIVGYYKQFSKKSLRHNPGPVHFFPIAQNNRFPGGVKDNASWLDQPPPFSDGSFHWKIPNKFRVVTESGDGKKYTTVIQEFGMEASGKARVDKAGEHTEHP